MSLLNLSVGTIRSHPIILLPFSTVAFLHLFIIEIFYFSPRYPLKVFFDPLVRKLWGEGYLHYPANFLIFPQLFYSCQIVLFIFVTGFFIGWAVKIIEAVEQKRKLQLGRLLMGLLPSYIHILVASVLSFLVFRALIKSYELLLLKLNTFGSGSQTLSVVYKIMLEAGPYVSVLFGAIVIILFAFVIPLIVLEKKKIHQALLGHFRLLFSSWGLISRMVLIPTFIYLPVVLLRENSLAIGADSLPEFRVILLAFGVVIVLMIDAVVYTAVTKFILGEKKE